MNTAATYLALALLMSQFSPIAIADAHPMPAMPAMPVMDVMSTYKLHVVPIFKREDLEALTAETALKHYGMVLETSVDDLLTE